MLVEMIARNAYLHSELQGARMIIEKRNFITFFGQSTIPFLSSKVLLYSQKCRKFKGGVTNFSLTLRVNLTLQEQILTDLVDI